MSEKPADENLWDRQYAKGLWDVLKSPLEEERFEAVRKCIYQYSVNGAILELGCGEGLLQAKLNKSAYSKFVGVDISQVAINNAAALQDDKTVYLQADMETFEPDGKFDIIIFNESLYYSKSPLQLMDKYFDYLEEDGKIIISIYEDIANMKLLNLVNGLFPPAQSHISQNQRGRWHCNVYQKKA